MEQEWMRNFLRVGGPELEEIERGLRSTIAMSLPNVHITSGGYLSSI
jgi:hypothetical protein